MSGKNVDKLWNSNIPIEPGNFKAIEFESPKTVSRQKI